MRATHYTKTCNYCGCPFYSKTNEEIIYCSDGCIMAYISKFSPVNEKSSE